MFGVKHKHEVKQISLQFGGFDFVSIDIEGTSADLFLYALTMISPKCWCVEHDGRFRELEEKARRQYGYRLASQNGENCIFVREGA